MRSALWERLPREAGSSRGRGEAQTDAALTPVRGGGGRRGWRSCDTAELKESSVATGEPLRGGPAPKDGVPMGTERPGPGLVGAQGTRSLGMASPADLKMWQLEVTVSRAPCHGPPWGWPQCLHGPDVCCTEPLLCMSEGHLSQSPGATLPEGTLRGQWYVTFCACPHRISSTVTLIRHPELALLQPWWLYPLPVAAVTKHHRPGDLKHQAVEARVQGQGVSRAVLL